ncbi:MAG TPA: aldose epimerase family protein [Opitutaceae bacterium]|nr:aldose epimerase family protein [Opitutaceae bacterium]
MNARMTIRLFTLILAWGLSAPAGGAAGGPGVQKMPFGEAGGLPVHLYVLTNAGGMVAKVMTYGATLTELDAPDRSGKLDDVVLGFDSLGGYLGKEPFFGATVGRVGNRIAKGRFTLDGKAYQLAVNDGPNHLHGGIKGFDKVVWDAEAVPGEGGPSVRFSYLSRDGEEGYPGNCRVTVLYKLTSAGELRLDYAVTTDRDTPVNVTNHSYFNLAGPENGDILGHELTLDADRFTPVDSTLIPTGELAPVAGTPMDFLRPTRIGAHIEEVGGHPVGYDHNYVINGGGGKLAPVATVYEPGSGRVMEVSSTEPGVQFYTGNFLDGTITGKKGVVYRQHWALCLETQHFPDSVNHPNFPSYVLKAGATYRSTTIYRFGVR